MIPQESSIRTALQPAAGGTGVRVRLSTSLISWVSPSHFELL